jgi:hypothetical protein
VKGSLREQNKMYNACYMTIKNYMQYHTIFRAIAFLVKKNLILDIPQKMRFITSINKLFVISVVTY